MDVGDIIGGRFRLLSLAGTGGMGKVYRALDERSKREVGIKILSLDAKQYSRRFLREAKMMSQLVHPNIVGYIDYGETEDGAPFIAMEWIEGEDLRQRMNRRSLTLDEARRILACVGDALAYAHDRGVIHRDLKPSNLMLVSGNIDNIKLLDFGIARWRGPKVQKMTRTGISIGTPGYMAPEQGRGQEDIDGRADLFALGCVIYECLLGHRIPGPGDAGYQAGRTPRVSDERLDIHPELDDLLAEMMDSDIEKRPYDGRALANRARNAKHTRQNSGRFAGITDRENQRFLCMTFRGDSLLKVQGLPAEARLVRGEAYSMWVFPHSQAALESLTKDVCAIAVQHGSQTSIAIDCKVELISDDLRCREILVETTDVLRKLEAEDPFPNSCFVSPLCAELARDEFQISEPNPQGFARMKGRRATPEAKERSEETAREVQLAGVQQSLSSLPSLARKLLRGASIFDGRFWKSGVCQLVGTECKNPEASASMAVLEKSKFVRKIRQSQSNPYEALYQFSDPIISAAAHQLIEKEECIDAHRAAARWLEYIGSKDTTAIAKQFELGGDRRMAAMWYADSAREFFKAGAFEESMKSAQKGLRCGYPGAEGALYAAMARTSLWGNDIAAACENASTALDLLAVSESDWAECAYDAIEAFATSGAFLDVSETVEQLEEHYNIAESEVARAALFRASQRYFEAGRISAGEDLLAKLSGQKGEQGFTRSRGDCLLALAQRAMWNATYEEALVHVQGAITSFEEADFPRLGMLARCILARVFLELGRYSLANQCLEKVLASKALGARVESIAKEEFARVQTFLGNLQLGEEIAGDCVRVFAGNGDERRENESKLTLSEIARLRGDTSSSLRWAQEALRAGPSQPQVRARAHAQVSRLLLAEHRPEEAQVHANAAMEICDRTRHEDLDVRVANLRAKAANGGNIADELREAMEILQVRSKKIRDEEQRESFLHARPAHAELLELADLHRGSGQSG